MRIAIEFPVALFQQAKASAVARGIALKERLRHGAKADARETGEPPWMAGFGGLSDLGDEHRRIREAIDDEFEGDSGEGP